MTQFTKEAWDDVDGGTEVIEQVIGGLGDGGGGCMSGGD